MNRFALRTIVADVLEIDPEMLTPDTDLTQLPTFDSVAVLSLMLELDDRARIRMTPDDASHLQFYRDIETLTERQGIALTD